MRVPFGEWLPDQPDLDNPGATVATNVVPRTRGSYGPLNSLAPFSSGALPARAVGAISAQVPNSGTVTNFAGTASGLFQFDGADFNDVSRGVGYSLSEGFRWSFAQFGDRVLAATRDELIQTWSLGSSSAFADLNSDAPRAAYIATVRDFVMVGNVRSASLSYGTDYVWWSGINDATNWPIPGSQTAAQVLSDRQQLPLGGPVQGLTGAVGGADGIVFKETAIYRAQFEGVGLGFGFYEVEQNRGLYIPGSLVNIGAAAWYCAHDGFFRFDGAGSAPIGAQRIDRFFFDDLAEDYLSRVSSASDPLNKLYLVAYPGSGTRGDPNRLLIYNWELDRWALGEVDAQLIYRALSPGYSLEALDAFGTMETLPFSLDSEVWRAGALIVAALNDGGRLSAFTGTALEAVIETGEFGSSEHMRSFVTAVRALVDGGTPRIAMGYRDTPQAPVTWNSSTVAGADGACPQRVNARYFRARLRMDAGASWTHAQGIEPIWKPAGRR